MKKNEINHNIKIDDVFCLDTPCGRNGRFIQFFQVVGYRGKTQVVVREIKHKKVGETNTREDLVMPDLNHFKEKSSYIEDNEKGMAKTVQTRKNYDDEDITYICFRWYFNRSPYDDTYYKMACYEWADLWCGEPEVHYIDYMD